MIRRGLVLLIALFLLVAPAHAADPAVMDSALVLSDMTKRDIGTLNARLEGASGVTLSVITRHFLDGAQPTQTAQTLLDSREDSEHTVLLLLVVGEERFAFAVGDQVRPMLPSETITSLTAARLAAPFADRAYDRAVGDTLSALARQIASSSGQTIRTDDLFGAQPPQVTQAPGDTANPIREWLERITPTADGASADGDETGLSIGKIVFIGVALYLIFGRGKRNRRGGCASLLWLVVIFGVAGAFNFLK